MIRSEEGKTLYKTCTIKVLTNYILLGRFIVAGMTKPQLEAFLDTRKASKTEHILGIVEVSQCRSQFKAKTICYLTYQLHHATIYMKFSWIPMHVCRGLQAYEKCVKISVESDRF